MDHWEDEPEDILDTRTLLSPGPVTERSIVNPLGLSVDEARSGPTRGMSKPLPQQYPGSKYLCVCMYVRTYVCVCMCIQKVCIVFWYGVWWDWRASQNEFADAAVHHSLKCVHMYCALYVLSCIWEVCVVLWYRVRWGLG